MVTTAAPVLSTALVMKDSIENKLTSLIFGLLNGIPTIKQTRN